MTPLVTLNNLTKQYPSKQGPVNAVTALTLEIFAGEILGLVGESGCGKSTVAKMLVGLTPPTSGTVTYHAGPRTPKRVQMIFQDPYGSLNPRMTVGESVGEPLDIHNLASSATERQQKIEALFSLVGLKKEHLNRYPHEFSGGQRQRVGIARALAIEPEFIVCDEPISALDVSVQAQVVNLLKTLQKEKKLTYLFIAHDLSMVHYLSDRVAVMYRGHLAELASAESLYSTPLHPYTQLLLSAIPNTTPAGKEKKEMESPPAGELPNPTDCQKQQSQRGCVFHKRCPFAQPVCKQVMPSWVEAKPHHFVACHLHSIPIQSGSCVQSNQKSPCTV